MQKLNLPAYNIKIKNEGEKTFVFDPFRKKLVVLTPEEWVRQHFLNFLTTEKNYPASLIAVEKSLKVNNLEKRTDIVLYNKMHQPHLIVECKAPDITITQAVFEQVARYNITLKTPYLIVTNGISHYCCKINFTDNSFQFIENIPDFQSLEA